MSKVLCSAVLQALKDAHSAYRKHRFDRYQEHMKVADCALEAIRSLGQGGERAREMEVMALSAEVTLMHALADIHYPDQLRRSFEVAELQMLLPPSRVITREDPMLPNCTDALEFFGGPSEETAQALCRATDLYGRLTDGGGGGVAEIYRAQLAHAQGQTEEATRWARLARERMCGDRWIEPIVKSMLMEA